LRHRRAQATTRPPLKGTTLTSHGEVTLGSRCGEEDNVDPFILGRKNTPVNDRQGIVVGSSPFCPYGGFGSADTQHTVAAVSIGK
jgi:hypothetical protein